MQRRADAVAIRHAINHHADAVGVVLPLRSVGDEELLEVVRPLLSDVEHAALERQLAALHPGRLAVVRDLVPELRRRGRGLAAVLAAALMLGGGLGSVGDGRGLTDLVDRLGGGPRRVSNIGTPTVERAEEVTPAATPEVAAEAMPPAAQRVDRAQAHQTTPTPTTATAPEASAVGAARTDAGDPPVPAQLPVHQPSPPTPPPDPPATVPDDTATSSPIPKPADPPTDPPLGPPDDVAAKRQDDTAPGQHGADAPGRLTDPPRSEHAEGDRQPGREGR